MTPPDDSKMDAERKAVALFLNRIRSLAGYKDAIQCAEERPPKGQPGRAIRSRFDGFLHSFVIPEGAGLDEAIEYARLFECFVREGAVRKDTVAFLRGRIQRSMAALEQRGGSQG
ncbi:hypothetical protein LuPra_02830 [Luteitalea pratensis]|uniref:Uncharacterized protein n=1 Tax=Luteitalea pratensis TaxID=1855912 RepID=A0A143PM87_LUTPR|nr:hypothetical protein [Luteitalea pratensis]AMY09611.1 hypothetical protein LuPra_02830 [Luteitalea pratensis]